MIRYTIRQIMRRPHIYLSVVCFITALCGYLLSYFDNGISGRWALLVIFYFSAIIWGYLLITYFVKTLILRLRAKKSGDIEAPEFKKLAEEMKIKLNKNHPFVLQKEMDGAYYNPQNQRVVFGEILFNRLTPPERLATLSHELTHVKNRHFLKIFAIPTFTFMLAALTMRRELDLIWFITWIALSLAIFPHVSRRLEYEADAEAASRTSVEDTASSLKKVAKEERWNRETVTHPSINKRIKNLSRNHKLTPPNSYSPHTN